MGATMTVPGVILVASSFAQLSSVPVISGMIVVLSLLGMLIVPYSIFPSLGAGANYSSIDVDWDAIRVEQADWDPRLDNQFSGGSLSIRLNYTAMRKAGATAKAMLLAAASQRLNTPEEDLATEGGFVLDPTTGTKLGYGELAEAAARIPVPEDPPLKPLNQLRLVGRSRSHIDLEEILRIEEGTDV